MKGQDEGLQLIVYPQKSKPMTRNPLKLLLTKTDQSNFTISTRTPPQKLVTRTHQKFASKATTKPDNSKKGFSSRSISRKPIDCTLPSQRVIKTRVIRVEGLAEQSSKAGQ